MAATRMPDGTITVTSRCPRCAGLSVVQGVDYQRYMRWRGGVHIQRALPELSPADRETLMTGYHSACFDLDFPDEDE